MAKKKSMYNSRVRTMDEIYNIYCNRITCLNLSQFGHNSTVIFSRRIFRAIVDFDLVDDCFFNIVVH